MNENAARSSSPAMTSGNCTLCRPSGVDTSAIGPHVLPPSVLVAIFAADSVPPTASVGLLPSSQPKYSVPFGPTATDGSDSSGFLLPSGPRRTDHDAPLFSLTVRLGRPPKNSLLVRLLYVGVPPQPLSGRYAVPSGPTRTWPCSAEHAPPNGSPTRLAGVFATGTAGANVTPPSRLTAHWPLNVSCAQ